MEDKRPRRRTRRRRVLKVLLCLLVVWLVVDKAVSVVAPPPQVGHWKSREGFGAYKSAYDDVIAALPGPTRTHDIRTDYGTVRVYEWTAPKEKQQGKLPVVLLPGIRSGGPMWGENLKSWIGERTVFTMDAIGDAGMSVQTVPLDSFEEHGNWVEQVLDAMKIERAHVVGHSFGGALAAGHALHHPRRVATLTLLEPVIVLEGLPASVYFWSSMLFLPVPQSWKDRAMAEVGGTSVEEVQEQTAMSVMIDEGTRHFAGPILTPRTFTDEDWTSMQMPVRVDIASDKSLAGGQKAAQRARDLGKAPVTIWPNTTHSLPMQVADPLGEELKEYWSEHE